MAFNSLPTRRPQTLPSPMQKGPSPMQGGQQPQQDDQGNRQDRASAFFRIHDIDVTSPEGRFLNAYRAMTPFAGMRRDPQLVQALSGLFGGSVNADIGAEATLGLPGAQATAQNQFEDAELERRLARMGQDFSQQQLLDEYSDDYLQRRQQAAGDRIAQLLERLREQQGQFGQVPGGFGQLQDRIRSTATPLLHALGLGSQ